MTRKSLATALFLVATMVTPWLTLPVQAVADPYAQLDVVTKNIIQKLFELERFNMRFRQLTNVQGRWRGPRYFLSQEANAAATDAGLIVGIAERGRIINRPITIGFDYKKKQTFAVRRKPNRITIEHGFIPQMVGQFIGAGGSAFEFGVNQFHDYQAWKQGFSPAQARSHVLGLKTELAALMAQRSALAQGFNGVEREIVDAEGRVLKDEINLDLSEYVRYHITARRFRAFQDSLYLLDIAKNTVGAAGNIVAWRSVARRRPGLNGPAGLCTGLSGILIMLTPVASRGYGKLVSIYARKRLAPHLEDTEDVDLEQLKADHAALAGLIKKADSSGDLDALSSILDRVAVYEDECVLCQKKEDLANRELAAGTRVATQNILSGTAIGGTKTSLGICSMVAGWGHHKDSVLTNKLLFSGSVAYCAGTSLGLLDNIRIQVNNERNRRKFSKQRLLPGQIFKDHAAKLDEFEKRLNVVGSLVKPDDTKTDSGGAAGSGGY